MLESTALWIVWIVLQCTTIAGLALLLLVGLGRVLPETRGRIALAGLAAMSAMLLLGLLPGGGWIASRNVAQEAASPNRPTPPATEESATAETPPSEAIPAEIPSADELEGEALAQQWQRLSGWFAPGVQPLPLEAEEDGATTPVAGAAAATNRTIWLRWVLLVLAAVQLLAIARIVGGFWAVLRLRSRAIVCEDAEAISALDRLIQQSGIRRPVELMVSREINTPAMLGWRRITILLPPEYTQWSTDQLQAVLAHELAHVARRDGLWRTIAALLQSLHFYNPLAHLLARRFILEQELAADRLACQWLGQRETYLQSVANLALGRKAPQVGWSTLAFLPSRSTLVRRLEMLRYMPDAVPRSVERTLQAAALLVLVTATVVVGGLRPLGAQPPAEENAVIAEEKETPQRLAELVPAEWGHMVLEVNFEELLKSSEFAQMLARPEGEEDPLNPSARTMLKDSLTVIEPEDVDSILIMQEVANPVARPEGGIRYPVTLLFVRSKREIDLQKLTGDRQPPAENGTGVIRLNPAGFALQLSPQVFAHGPRESDLKELAELRKKPAAERRSLADELARSEALVRASIDWTKVQQNFMEEEPGFANSPIQTMVAPLTRPANRWTLELHSREESLEATLVGQFGTPEQAAKAKETLLGLRPLLKNLHEGTYAMFEDLDAPQETLDGAKRALDLVGQLLESAEVEVRESEAVVTAQGEGRPDLLMAAMLPAFQQSRLAADRMRDLNDMKHVALAFHNYADVHKHFPAPVVIDAESGQKRSWRVELLPYLEQQALYDQYRKDEPWDSEANLKVLEQIPAVYRSARQRDATSTSVYVVTGKDTATDGEKPYFTDVTDGTSNTVLYIQTQRDTPWTKPEDIPLEGAIAAQLGGFHPGGFIMARVDGSVTFVPNTIHHQVWVNLLIRNDGQVIP